MKIVRIGAGAGYAGDRIEPAVELAMYGSLDYLVFECLAERTIALGSTVLLQLFLNRFPCPADAEFRRHCATARISSCR